MRTFYYIQFLLSFIVVMASGCSLIDHPERTARDAPRSLGTITTGGTLGISQTLSIPISGFSLSDVVEESLRPGVRQLTVQSLPASPTLQPVGSNHISRISQLQSTLASLRPLLADASKPLPIDSFVASDFNRHTQKAVLEPTTLTQQEFDSIHREVTSILNEGRKNGSFASIEKMTLIFDQLKQVLQISNVPQTNFGAPSTGFSTGFYYRTAVILTRRSGSRFIAPLWLVQMFPAGDVAVADGDNVRIEPYNRTEVGSRQIDGKDGAIVIEGITRNPRTESLPVSLENVSQTEATSMGAFVSDIIILRHFNRLGQLEEYLIPRLISGTFGEDPEFSRFLAETRLAAGDIVEFQNLSLLSEIRRGRMNAIVSSADAIESRRHHCHAPEAVRERQDRIQQFTGISRGSVQDLGRRTQETLHIIPEAIGF